MPNLLNREFLMELLLQAPIFLLALTLHELAHGYVAYRLGDNTAKDEGRLTLNPLKHLDLLGVLAFIFLKVGWAKPVPVNPGNFANPQKDMLKVAVAGPAANLFTAIVSAILLQLSVHALGLHSHAGRILMWILVASVYINVMLAVFNLLPIPPMDGSRILMGIMSPQSACTFARIEPYGFILVLILFYTGILGKIIMPIIRNLAGMLIG